MNFSIFDPNRHGQHLYIFYFIGKPESCAPDSVFRDVPFEVITKNDVFHRFDTSHKFWEKYGVRNEHLKKAWLLFY